MIQPHNRHMSISLYISALAVTDTMDLLIGKRFITSCGNINVGLQETSDFMSGFLGTLK